MHILDQEFAGLAAKLVLTPPAKRRRIVAAACNLAARDISDPGPAILALLTEITASTSLSESQLKAAETMANEADEHYFALQESGAPENEWAGWFSKARLLTAIKNGFEDTSWESSADAIYELSHAAEAPADLLTFVMSELESMPDTRSGK